jgi:DUF1680 family protein
MYMKKTILITLIVLLTISCNKKEDESFPSIIETPFTDVRLTDDFWAPKIKINRTVSILSAFHQCEINGRFDNFALAGGLIEDEHKGEFSFDDTDPYKIIEGASYSLVVEYSPKLDAYLDSVITLIAAAQEPDGYLTTCVTNKCERLSGWWGTSRWEKINSHELYNSGHLYEAAVAHYQATGKRTLLDVALKNADLVCKTFGLGEGQIKYPSGHPIIEMALVKLYCVTGEKKYLEQARYFVDEAGRLSNGRRPGIYSQDHKPVMEQDEIVGHAVRAAYFYSGVTDVAVLQKDKKLLDAVKRIWDNMAGRKLYLNGGIGSRAQGEGFGPDYELNNFNNYCETCASIANVFWNHRLFLATGEAKYIDVLERSLYNGLIAGVSLSGDRFFYDNPMTSHGHHNREPWFGCACCPGNITRFMASISGYLYATNKQGIFVNLYASGNAVVKYGDAEVELLQETQYPWNGEIALTVNPAETQRFSLMLRIPGWANGKPVPSDLYHYVDTVKSAVRISLNGQQIKFDTDNGYAVVEREWKKGDKISLSFDMPVRRVQAHEEVVYDKGLLAMERGPVLYALESIDQPETYLFDIVIPRDSKIDAHFEKDTLGGIVVLTGNAFTVEKKDNGCGYIEKPFTFKAIPYSVWNNRGIGQMLVWTPEKAEHAVVKPETTIASKARTVDGWGFNDRFEPASSSDINTPYHGWWKSGTEESVGYRFDKPETVAAVDVYWLEFEHYDVSYKAPKSWKLMYSDGNQWKEVQNHSPYGTDLDCYNRVTFDPVVTAGLKIVVQLQEGYSGGVIEWKVFNSAKAVTSVPESLQGCIDASFYKKYADAGGIPVVASQSVRDEALIAACKIIPAMLAKRPDIAYHMRQKACKVMIIGEKEQTLDLPEYRHLGATEEDRIYWNKRTRGFGGAPEHDVSASCGEENLICLPGDRYEGENILIHEFAHIIHLVGIAGAEPDFNDRLTAVMNKAIEKGLWKDTYAISNKEEYFAETVQSFFNCNRYSEKPNGVHNNINTRDKLKKYDPEMYELLLQYFYEEDIPVCNNI